MMTDQGITVIIPAYNQAEYIRQAVESVFHQTLPATKVLVVNDGSTDNTEAVLRELQIQYPTLEVLTQSNQGVIASCALALEQVATPLMLRLDGDDYIPDTYLEKLAATLDSNAQASFAYCDGHYFGSRTGWMRARAWSVAHLTCENYIHVSSLLRTDVVRQVGYFNPKMDAGFEDWDFYLALAEQGFWGAYCRDTFLWYRQKAGGGRNDMQQAQERRMREQVRANHPRLFQNPVFATVRTAWRLRRKLQHWLG